MCDQLYQHVVDDLGLVQANAILLAAATAAGLLSRRLVGGFKTLIGREKNNLYRWFCCQYDS